MEQVVSAQESAYNGIKQQILDGRLSPGTRLLHRNLAKELKVSSISVVPALRMLELDGLVVNTPGVGARVKTWTRDEIVDLYHIRASLEALACRLAAERANYSDIEPIERFNKIYKEATISEDASSKHGADLGFHLAVVDAAHCSELQRLVENLCIISATMHLFSVQLGIGMPISTEQVSLHDPILAAIKDHDPEAAWQAGMHHVEEGLAKNLKWIEVACDALQNVDDRPRKLSVDSLLQTVQAQAANSR